MSRVIIRLATMLLATAYTGFAVPPTSAAEADAGSHQTSVVVIEPVPASRTRGIHPQIPNVGTPVAHHYRKADSVSLAIAIVPDPLVPRYRRLYDLKILALELGMLKDGYVLDRFSFPWSDELRGEKTISSAGADAAEGQGILGSYGLMTFRCDMWRGDRCAYPGNAKKSELVASTRVRALYVLTETATFGVSPFQLRCAISKIESQTGIGPNNVAESATTGTKPRGCPDEVAPPKPNISATLLRHPLCPSAQGISSIVVLGPNFSGAMNSIGETAEGRIPNAERHICLVTAFATDRTNDRISSKYKTVHYETVALDNHVKIRHLADLSANLGATRASDIAILTEASTFGYGVCRRDVGESDVQVKTLCASPTFFFPPTIADIAYGVQRQQAQQANDLANATRQLEDTHHVSLEAGAENGSEFPSSESSALTSASNQLQLDRVMEELTKLGPKIVIVIATDVRDRLFLFDQLREKLPRAMLVDLEADNLLSHPNFLHSSRGAIATASTNLDSTGAVYGCDPSPAIETGWSWSIDGQGLLAENTALLYEGDLEASAMPCAKDPALARTRQAALQLVTYHGFKPVSYAFPERAASFTAAARPNFCMLAATEWLACIFCISISALWLWPWALQASAQKVTRENKLVVRIESWCLNVALVIGVLFLLCTLIVVFCSTEKPDHSVMYWVVVLEIVGVVGLWRCYGQIRHALWASRYAAYSSPWLSAALAMIAVGLSAVTILISSRVEGNKPLIDPVLVNALGFDPDSGVAFYLVVALATLVTLYASAILATRVWVVRRNFRLLILASSKYSSISFVPRDENNKRVEILHSYRPLPMWVVVVVSSIIVFAAGAPGLLDSLGGPRLTVFGPVAARSSVIALSVTTLCASILLFAAYGAGRRIRALCGYVRSRMLEQLPPPVASSSEMPGLWSGGAEMPISFPATPVLAMDAGAGRLAKHVWTGTPTLDSPDTEAAGEAWAASLAEILHKGAQNSRTRFALFALLVSELSLFRWIAVGAVLCAFAGVAVVYLYPIEADSLLVLNLFILTLAGLLCAYLAVVFERDEVLSNIVSNRPKKAEVSVGLFSFVASPFVALAAAIALIGIPGVVDWAGGLFLMLRSLGIHP